MLWAKASPGGEAGSPQGLTDEVEVTNHNHELVRRCYLRPHPVRLEPDHHSRGMTATGSHIDSYSLRGAPPSRGRLSLRRVLRIEFERAGHAVAPTRKNDTASRPSSVTPLACHLPPGEGFSLSQRAFASNLPLRHCNQAGGACHRPYSAPPGGVPFQISSLSP